MLVAAEDAEEVDLELPEGGGLLRVLGDFPAHLLAQFCVNIKKAISQKVRRYPIKNWQSLKERYLKAPPGVTLSVFMSVSFCCIKTGERFSWCHRYCTK